MSQKINDALDIPKDTHMHILPWCRRLLTLATTFCFIACNSAVLAQTATGSKGSGKGINLDLTSTVSVAAPKHLASTNPVNIVVGGNKQTVTSGSQLTAAERVAVFQVMRTGQQSIQLGSQGNAVGGSFTIGSRLSQHISNLVIPAGVTAVDNASRSSTLNLTGNLTNAGTLYVLSTNPAITTATISAANITNRQGALLTTVLPASGLPGFNNLVSSLNLNLTALQNIVNAGTISSSGSLTASAGGSIINALPAGVTGARPVMQAVNNITLLSQAGNFVNAGLIAAKTGNINVSTGQIVSNILMNNAGGTLQALNGTIAFRDAGFSALADLTVTGGDFLSKQLDFNSGQGTVTATLGQVTGTMNVSAGQAHMFADTNNLILGNNCITGDPTFVNTGDISIAGPVTASESLAIIAGGNITATSPTASISTSGSTGHDIVLIAGATLTYSGSSYWPSSIASGETAGVSFTSSNGGSIDLTAGVYSENIVDTHATSAGSAGGNVTLVAYSNGPNNGYIALPTRATINSAGNGSGANGSVVMYSGGIHSGSGYGISVGNIQTTTASSTGAAGDITLITAQPVATGLSFDSHGVQSGTLSYSSTTTVNSAIATGSLATYTNGSGAAGNILLIAGGGINAGGIDAHSAGTQGGSITLVSGTETFALGSLSTASSTGNPGALTFENSTSVIDTATVSFAAGSNIDVSGNSNSATPSLSFILANNNSLGRISTHNAGSGAAGNVSLESGANCITISDVIDSSSIGGTPGDITISAPHVAYLGGSSNPGDAQNITINANWLYVPVSGWIKADNTLTINSYDNYADLAISGSGTLDAPTILLSSTGGSVVVGGLTITNTSTVTANVGPNGAILLHSPSPISFSSSMSLIQFPDYRNNYVYYSVPSGGSAQTIDTGMLVLRTSEGPDPSPPTIIGNSITEPIPANARSGEIIIYVSDSFTGNGSLTVSNPSASQGNIVITSPYSLTLSSTGSQSGNITIQSGDGISANNIAASNSNSANGNGGAVTLTAGSYISISNGIDSSSSGGSGNGGAVTLTAGSYISISGTYGGDISSCSNGGGNGGAVTLTAGSYISIMGDMYGGGISSGGNGNGGAVTLTAGSYISMMGDVYGDGISSNGVAVTLTAGSNISISGGISSYSYGSGNGVAVTLTAGSYISIGGTYDGGITSSSSGGGNGGAVTLTAGSYISISGGMYGDGISSGGNGNGGAVTLTAGSNISISGGIISYSYGGGNGGAVTLTAGSNSSTGGITLNNVIGSSIILTSHGGDIVTNAYCNIYATNGALQLIANGGIQIGTHSTLSATEGNLILQDLNTTSGEIVIGAGATLMATTTESRSNDKGNVYLVIGDIPTTLVQGSVPDNVTLSMPHGGQAYFGVNGILGLPPNNVLTADGGWLVFNTGPLPGSAITLEGVVTISSTAAPQPIPPSPPPPPCTNCQPPLLPPHCTDCIPTVVLPPTRGGDPIALSVDKTPPRDPAKPMPLPLIEDFQIEQYIVAGSPCTLYECPALGGSQVQGQPGTIFSVKRDKTFVLIGGRMLAGAGESGLDIQLGSSKQHIKLKGKTIAIVDAQAKAGVRVTVLAGNGPDAVSVGVGNESLVALGSGEEALLMDQGSTEQLIAADGVERQPIGGSVTKFGLTMHKASVSVDKLVRRETLLTCCFTAPGAAPHMVCRDSWVSKRLHQLYGENQGPELSQTTAPVGNSYPVRTSGLFGGTGTRNTNNQMVSTQLEGNENYTTFGQLIPIAYVSGVVPTDLRIGQDAEVVNIGPGYYRLVRGTILTAADRKLTIETEQGTVVARAGAGVVISAGSGLTQVLNLVDRAKGDVSVIANARFYELPPGGAVGIIKGASKTEAVKLVNQEKLARRRMQILDVNTSTKLVTNDFSVLDALQRISLLSTLRKSTAPADQHLFSSIIKMAAALSMTTDRTHGSYSVSGGQ